MGNTVSYHRSYTTARLSTATRREVVTASAKALSAIYFKAEKRVRMRCSSSFEEVQRKMGSVGDYRCSDKSRKLSAADERYKNADDCVHVFFFSHTCEYVKGTCTHKAL